MSFVLFPLFTGLCFGFDFNAADAGAQSLHNRLQ